jgi:hypothetical protein
MRIPHPWLPAALAACTILLAACGTSTPPAAGANASPGCAPAVNPVVPTVTCAFTFNVANFLLTPPGPPPAAPGYACPPGSMLVSGATVSGTDSVSWGGPAPNGSVEATTAIVRIRSVIPDGTGQFVVAGVDPTDATCTRTVNPATTVPFTWTATHAGRVDRSDVPNCTFQSNLTFGSLTLSPAGPLSTPRPVDVVLRDSMHVRLDALIADRVDFITRGAAHVAGTGARCPDWTRLAPGS